MEEKNEVKKKDNYWIVTVIVLAAIILGMGGYIAYDKVATPKPVESESVESESAKESSKTVTDEVLNNLIAGLVSSDKGVSLYGDVKINAEESGKDFILFNVYEYMKKNNIEPAPGINPSDGTKISKEKINKYINEKYNTTIKYDLPAATNESDVVGEIGCISIFSLDAENWSAVSVGKTCGNDNLSHKLVNKEETNDELVLYTNVAGCYTELQSVECRKGISINTGEKLFLCNSESEYSENCPDEVSYDKNLSLEEYTNYVLSNMSDKLRTYKVVFKKADGNYYFVSSEIYKS